MAIQNPKERIEAVEVDINDTSLAEGVEQELDLKEDWQARACPPPGRTEVNKPKLYKVRYFIDDDKFEQGTKMGFKADDPNGKYYTKQIIAKIQDPTGKWQDSVCYYKVSTGVPKGKKISSMAGFLSLIKVKVPAKINDLKLARLLVAALAKLDGPLGIIDADWQAWDKTKTSKRQELGSVAILSNGKVASSMANFPKNTDGSFQHIAFTKDGLEVVANLKILRLLPIASAAPVATGATNGVAKTTPQAAKPVPPPVVPEPVSEIMDEGMSLDAEGEVILEM